MRTDVILLGMLVGAAGFAGSPVGAQQPEPANAHPNIILCLTDDQGWGDVGYNGNPVLKTPNLDDMARSGIRFDRFYSAQFNCSPTRASILSGRHPSRYRCYSWGYDLPLREVTIAEAVRTKGYATGHFGKWHVGGVPNPQGGTGRGVAEGVDAQPRHPGNQGFDEWCSAGNWFDLDSPAGTLYRNGQDIGPITGDTSDVILEEALRFIRKNAEAKRPFLALVWFTSPHGPWKALPKDKAPYASQGEQADFYGECAAVDRAMGRLRRELRTLGIRDNTMLWFNSDNGAQGGSAGGLSGQKGNLFEGGIRMPGLLEWPARVRKPFRTDFPVCTVDYYPTICDLLGIRMAAQVEPLDGISLLPLIEGKMATRPKPLCFEQRNPQTDKPQSAAIIDNQYKLVRIITAPGAKGKRTSPLADGREHLVDLGSDPAEQRDVASENPEVFARLRKQLSDWESSVEQSLKDYPGPTVTQPTLGTNIPPAKRKPARNSR